MAGDNVNNEVMGLAKLLMMQRRRRLNDRAMELRSRGSTGDSMLDEETFLELEAIRSQLTKLDVAIEYIGEHEEEW